MITEGMSPGFVQTSGSESFGGCGWWGFLILALFFFGGNGFGRNTNSANEDVWKSQEFGQLENAVRANGQGICDASWALNNSIKDGNFAIQRGIDGVNQNLGNALCSTTYELAGKIAELSRQNSECCCTTQRAIDSVNYNGAMNTASINQNTTAQTQKILDAISANKIENLQNQVNQLQLQNAMAGVVRYPNGWTYNAGTSPFCNGGCSCGCVA